MPLGISKKKKAGGFEIEHGTQLLIYANDMKLNVPKRKINTELKNIKLYCVLVMSMA